VIEDFKSRHLHVGGCLKYRIGWHFCTKDCKALSVNFGCNSKTLNK
jgi:hypothetical protein